MTSNLLYNSVSRNRSLFLFGLKSPRLSTACSSVSYPSCRGVHHKRTDHTIQSKAGAPLISGQNSDKIKWRKVVDSPSGNPTLIARPSTKKVPWIVKPGAKKPFSKLYVAKKKMEYEGGDELSLFETITPLEPASPEAFLAAIQANDVTLALHKFNDIVYGSSLSLLGQSEHFYPLLNLIRDRAKDVSVEQVSTILRIMTQDCGFPMNTVSYNAQIAVLLFGLAKAQDRSEFVQQAFDAFDKMKGGSLTAPSKETYDLMFKVMLPDMLLKHWNEYCTKFTPNRDTLMSIFQGLADSLKTMDGDASGIDEAASLLQEWQDRVYSFSIPLCAKLANKLMKAWLVIGQVEKARAIFDQTPAKDALLYTTMISGYGKKGDLTAVESLIQEMKAAHMPLDKFTYSAVVQTMVNADQLDEAVSLLRSICSSPENGSTPSENVLNTDALPSKTSVEVDAALFRKVFVSCCAQGRLADAEFLLQQMAVGSDSMPPISMTLLLMNAFIAGEQPRGALRLFEKVQCNRYAKLTPNLINCALKACIKSLDIKRMENVWASAFGRGILSKNPAPTFRKASSAVSARCQPDAESYNVVISGYLVTHLVPKALDVLKLMDQTDIPVHRGTLISMIEACAVSHRYEDAARLLVRIQNMESLTMAKNGAVDKDEISSKAAMFEMVYRHHTAFTALVGRLSRSAQKDGSAKALILDLWQHFLLPAHEYMLQQHGMDGVKGFSVECILAVMKAYHASSSQDKGTLVQIVCAFNAYQQALSTTDTTLVAPEVVEKLAECIHDLGQQSSSQALFQMREEGALAMDAVWNERACTWLLLSLAKHQLGDEFIRMVVRMVDAGMVITPHTWSEVMKWLKLGHQSSEVVKICAFLEEFYPEVLNVM